MCNINILITICCVLLIILILRLVLSLYDYSNNKSCFSNNSNYKSLEMYLKSKNAPSSILDLPLFNFYINSSHNSYLDSAQVGGISSASNTLRCLQMGARCIELDISRDTKDVPIVTHKDVDLKTSLLSDHFQIIEKNAFLNTNDPLFIFLEIYNMNYEDYAKNIEKLITQFLGPRLYEFTLSQVFKNKANDINKYLPNVPIKKLLGKICIIINYFGMNIGDGLKHRNKYLAPVVHATTDEPNGGWYGINSKSIIFGQPETAQIDNVFKNLGRVYTANLISAIKSSDNYNIQPYIDNGYSFNAINFTSKTNKDLTYNLEFFKSSNILPKNYYETNDGTLESIKEFKISYFFINTYYKWIQNATFNPVPVDILDHNVPLIPNTNSYPRLLVNHAYSNNCFWKFNNMTLNMQSNGNLVIYNKNKIINSIDTNSPNAVLIVNNDGELMIYSADGKNKLWTSNSNVDDIKIGSCNNYTTLSPDDLLKDFGRYADCPSEFKHTGLTCYSPEKSKSSDFGLGTDELADCPDGYDNTLTTCHRWGTSFQRDYFSKAGASINTDKKNCEKRFGTGNCEIRGVAGSRLARAKNCEIEAKYYNYKNPELYVDDGLTTMGARCYIHAHTIGSIKTYGSCPPKKDSSGTLLDPEKAKHYTTKTGAFCYVNCENEYGPGYYNNGTSCWRDPRSLSSSSMTCNSDEYKFTTPIIWGS